MSHLTLFSSRMRSICMLMIMLSALVSGALTSPTLADGGLYAAPPPPDAAFVRILNSDPTTEASVTVGGVSFVVPPSSVSPYRYVTRGEYDASGAGTLHVSVDAQKFYTILLVGGAASLLQDEALANPARAGLYFYNTTDAPLQLDAKLGGKQAAVFEAVAPKTSVFREVKPFEVAFVLVSGGKPVFELPITAMVSQQGMSVVALGVDGTITGIQAVNTVDVGN